MIPCLCSFWQIPLSSYIPLILWFLFYNCCRTIIANFHLRFPKASVGSGFVKMLATYSFVSTYYSFTTLWDTCSLRKWYFIDMCFFMECMTWFFEIFMALVLWQFILLVSHTSQVSTLVSPSQMTKVQHDAALIYLNFVVESEMEDCFLLNHETKQFPKKNAAPLFFFDHQHLLPNLHQ